MKRIKKYIYLNRLVDGLFIVKVLNIRCHYIKGIKGCPNINEVKYILCNRINENRSIIKILNNNKKASNIY